MAINIRKYSIEELNTLIESIKKAYSIREEEIAAKIGYNQGYISQCRSRGEVSPKFIQALIREFDEVEAVLPYGSTLKDLRAKYRLSQQDLSDQTGIPRPRLAKWEEGKGIPKTEDQVILDSFFAKLGETIKKKLESPTDQGQFALHKSILNLTESDLKTKGIIETLARNDTEKTDVIKKLVSILERNYQAYDPKLPMPRQEGARKMGTKKNQHNAG